MNFVKEKHAPPARSAGCNCKLKSNNTKFKIIKKLKGKKKTVIGTINICVRETARQTETMTPVMVQYLRRFIAFGLLED